MSTTAASAAPQYVTVEQYNKLAETFKKLSAYTNELVTEHNKLEKRVEQTELRLAHQSEALGLRITKLEKLLFTKLGNRAQPLAE
jgi:hypothetical protein